MQASSVVDLRRHVDSALIPDESFEVEGRSRLGGRRNAGEVHALASAVAFDSAAAGACVAGAPLGLNLVICFHERTRASAKISSKSPASPMRNAASIASCSSGMIEIALSGTPAARRACA